MTELAKLADSRLTAQPAWSRTSAKCHEPCLISSRQRIRGARRARRLPANLLQAQRDYFGAHTYERLDRPGKFHTAWTQA